MVKLWIKIIKENRIAKQTEVFRDEKFTYALFQEYISEGCYALDVSTPVIIRNHIMQFAKYNVVEFKAGDFMESVDFDKMTVENLNR